MDRLEELSSTLANITMYDIKSMYNQAKNAVLNISEMEAKVREATNDEPWGASSTLMQEIAQGTFNFQQFNEIMPCIYGRFMDKEARQWRQIYKALQLLEYLIKHGSERVVDDARSHIGTLKMLRSFHYIDEKGKDEGINVRNRAKELVELLSDVEKIRTERRKAKANRNKYVGVGNDGGYGGLSFNNGGSRYGGFGSDSLGGGGSYGNDYYGSSSSRTGGFSDSNSRRQYEEYDAGGDEISGSGAGSSGVARSSSARSPTKRQTSVSSPVTAAPAPPPAPVQNLLDFDDDVTPAAASALGGLATNKALPAVSKPIGLDDDDFDDFQAAPVQAQAQLPTQISPPVSPVGQQGVKPNLMQLLGNPAPLSPTTQTQAQQQPRPGIGGFGGMGMGGMQMHRAAGSMTGIGGVAMRPTPAAAGAGGIGMGGATSPMVPTPMRTNTASPVSQQKTATGGSAGGFDDLWNLSLASSGKAKPATGDGTQGKSMKDLQKEKATTGLWGGAAGFGAKPAAGNNTGFGNLSSGGGGGDDLLL